MKKIRLVSDSGADLYELEGVDFVNVPIIVNVDGDDYPDDGKVDIPAMMERAAARHVKSCTACPGVGTWIDSFGDADIVWVVTITSGLSGSYASAMAAVDQYKEMHPERHVHVVDSVNACGGQRLLVEKIRDMIVSGMSEEEMLAKIDDVRKNNGLVFCLATLEHFARAGRVPMAVAKLTGMLNIRLISIPDAEGRIHPVDKARGEKKSLQVIVNQMVKDGCKGGYITIDHCFNQPGADALAELMRATWPGCSISIMNTGALCSYYAQQDGILVGFTKA